MCQIFDGVPPVDPWPCPLDGVPPVVAIWMVLKFLQVFVTVATVAQPTFVSHLKNTAQLH